MEVLMEEVWRDIPGYEGYYQVSNLGRIKSLERRKRIGNGATQMIPERILKAVPYNKVGHLKVTLCKDGDHKNHPVHRAVMEAFCGARPEKAEIRHLNSNAQDNRLENLAYGTSTENHIDQSKMGHIGGQKLMPDSVGDIRKRLADGETCTKIAEDYGVTMYCIFDIKRGRTFSWVQEVTKDA
jgi:hypothetical protein